MTEQLTVLGNENFVLGFKLAGVKNTIISQQEELDKKIEVLVEAQEANILIMEQNDFDFISNKSKKILDKSFLPIVITISEKKDKSDIRELIKKSLGVDLWKE